MCGIAGIVWRAAPQNPACTVRRMIALQKHRGPDGEGFYESEHVALGHCRLAIIDTSDAGHQPMRDDRARYWVTYNGEIYNYLELAEELRRAGHAFRSRCDTEVLLAAYREWGPACVHRLRGMFAFAIWDDEEHRLFAARDRLGIKPFHYCTSADGSQLAFASEIKPLLEFLPERRINARLAHDFLAWNLLDHDGAETMFEGILRLPAGHSLVWDRCQGASLDRYWSLEVTERVHSSPDERAQLIEEFRHTFEQSVEIHLRADVPVGTCLSGGLDSSSIVCAVNRQLDARQRARADWQQTFSACFDDQGLDERSYVDEVASITRTQNHRVFPTGERLADEMDTWLWHQGEPVGGFGVYAQYCVMRLAREHGITVLLDGQGADEQLLGYRKFAVAYVRQLWQAGSRWRAIREAAAFVPSPAGLTGSPLVDGMRYLNRPAASATALWPESGPPAIPADLTLAPPLGARIHADVTRFSLPVLLRFEDRNSMAFGVESRVPFVDHTLVEWLARLPADLRLRNGWTKIILREALADILPPAVRLRKTKLGFTTPDRAWLCGPLRPWLTDLLSRPMHVDSFVDRAGLSRVLSLFQNGRATAATLALLSRLALFEHWARIFIRHGVG
jgi:asparagine synthase (glutamine-hydrolysing)